MPDMGSCDFHGDAVRNITTLTSIKNSLPRNQQLNRVNNLLSIPPPPPPLHRQQHATSSMMLNISHKAITKLATVRKNAGVIPIFTLLQTRPALLEKRITRPTTATAATAAISTEAEQQALQGKRRRL
jgi:hypothetical protein